MWGAHEGMGWWWAFGAFWMVVFWAAVIGLVVWVVNRFSDTRRDQPGIGPGGVQETPMDIARRRLARGEITREQFEELRELLEHSDGKPAER